MSNTAYLIKRHQTWFVRVQIPKRLWTAAGCRAFVKSLQTRDLQEANSRKHAYIAEYKRQIKALELVRDDPMRKLRLLAIEARNAIEQGKQQADPIDGGNLAWFFESEMLDRAKEIQDTEGEEAAKLFHRIASATTPPVSEHYEKWLDQQVGDLTRQTVSQNRATVQDFLQWAGEDITIGEVTRKLAGEFTEHLLGPQRGLNRKTVARHLSSLSSLWTYLEDRGLAPEGSNPWLRQMRGERGKRGQKALRSQWRDEQLVALLAGQATERYTATLHDLVRLALVTGARLDELCSLKTADVERRKDGWWIAISEGKTDAAVREVPIHDCAVHVLESRRATPDGFLFPGLVPGGPDKKRSWNVSKAFGRYCNNIGLTDKALVFHGLRKTFVEAMEAAGVPETTTKLLIGHARSSLTYGRYSQGERVTLRKAIDCLKYSRAVMKAIRQTGPASP